MKISKKCQYGLRALILLAKNPKRKLSISEISNREKIPADFLEKILSQLVKKKIVKAKKGIKGGYFLSKEPSKIKIIKIIEALEGEVNLVDCLKNFCPLSFQCCAKKFWKRLQRSIKEVLAKTSLAQII